MLLYTRAGVLLQLLFRGLSPTYRESFLGQSCLDAPRYGRSEGPDSAIDVFGGSNASRSSPKLVSGHVSTISGCGGRPLPLHYNGSLSMVYTYLWYMAAPRALYAMTGKREESLRNELLALTKSSHGQEL